MRKCNGRYIDRQKQDYKQKVNQWSPHLSNYLNIEQDENVYTNFRNDETEIIDCDNPTTLEKEIDEYLAQNTTHIIDPNNDVDHFLEQGSQIKVKKKDNIVTQTLSTWENKQRNQINRRIFIEPTQKTPIQPPVSQTRQNQMREVTRISNSSRHF